MEGCVLLMYQLRCPLIGLAARYTDDRHGNLDIYLPLWLAQFNKQSFGTLFRAGIVYAVLEWPRT